MQCLAVSGTYPEPDGRAPEGSMFALFGTVKIILQCSDAAFIGFHRPLSAC
jgi:hypothetical protein